MTREHVLIVLGALILLSPWSGIPMAWLEWAYLLIGIAVIGIAFMIRNRPGRTTLIPSSMAPVPVPSEEPRPRSSNIAFS
jgi:hypothetical protein